MTRSRQGKQTLYVNLKDAPGSLRDGLRELATEYPILFRELIPPTVTHPP